MSHKRRVARSEKEESSSDPSPHSPLVRYVMGAMEGVLLALVCLAPWPYGAVHPSFEVLLDAGIAVLLLLWAARMLLEGELTWKHSWVAVCLGALFLFAVWQRTPLPRPVLAWLSPGTERCYEELLPKEPEIVANSSADTSAAAPPGSTISLYPGATRKEAARLLAVFLVFVVVYNNLTSKESLIRLSWVALVNGVLLSLFALAQFFGAPRNTVYWTYQSQVTPFGPFICHNHFPDYVTMCIGLGIGLLLSQGKSGRHSSSEDLDRSPLQILQNPRALWICAAVGLMVSAVAFSRSRGGLLALVGTTLVCAVLGWLRLGRSFRLGSIVLILGVGLGLSAWFGLDMLKTRLASVFSGQALESRLPVWLRSLPIVANFPIWGTGFGTFGYIEPMYRKDVSTEETKLFFDHAHNDYLELLVEGGAISLALMVTALAVVYRRSYRALSAQSGRGEAGLTLGALFGFTALVMHSVADFGAHIPAITLMGTVLCARLCAMDTSKPQSSRSSRRRKHRSSTSSSATESASREKEVDKKDSDSDVYRLRLGGIAPILGAAAVLVFGIMLCAVAWKDYRIDRLEDAAFRAGDANPDQLHTRIACLAEAVSMGPEYARLHYDLGFAYGKLAELLDPGLFADRKAALEEATLALQEYIRARNACPLSSGAQLEIAAYASQLERGDTAEDYFRRVKRLAPIQDDKWYLCGLRESQQNRPEEAWATWRHCLELSKEYLPLILAQTRRLKTDRLLDKVLPDNPDILLDAALQLYPESGNVERRRPILEKALLLLESKGAELSSQDWLVRARAYRWLDEPNEAVDSYKQLLERKDIQKNWRLIWRHELAHYLFGLGSLDRLKEAQSEVLRILSEEPNDEQAEGLREAIKQRMLQGGPKDRPRLRPGKPG